MTYLYSSWNFISGVAVQAGFVPQWKTLRGQKANEFRKETRKRQRRCFRRLSERQRHDLLQSIRHDDWLE